MQYDTIIVGSGFAAAFFLHRYLTVAPPTARILVLERGYDDPLGWQVAHRTWSRIPREETFVNTHPAKNWRYEPVFGGTSNAWWACTPRFMPNDFRLHTTYGVGTDWSLSYDELEPYYAEVEEVMAVSGSDDGAPFPRSTPYPLPPHRFSNPDTLLKGAYPTQYWHQPTARARQRTQHRAMCCATGTCHLCAINAKFTVINEMRDLFDDPRITLRLGATAQTVETQGDIATGVRFTHDNGSEEVATADLVILAANAIFNPFILMRSGMQHPLLGKRLHEQVSVRATVLLNGVDNYQGSTSITGHGYMLYDGEHRAERGACLIETFNVPQSHTDIRLEPGTWRQRLMLKCIVEDLPDERNYVTVHADNPTVPELVYVHHADYAQQTIDALTTLLPGVLAALPVEDIAISGILPTEGHVQGTTLMGNDPTTSIVDRHLKHHIYRNLLVLGSSVFPSCSPANPTLTLSALSLWAADTL